MPIPKKAKKIQQLIEGTVKNTFRQTYLSISAIRYTHLDNYLYFAFRDNCKKL